MSTDWTASVRPVKSTYSVTSRSTGRLTGMAGGCAGATAVEACRQPPAAAINEPARPTMRDLRDIGDLATRRRSGKDLCGGLRLAGGPETHPPSAAPGRRKMRAIMPRTKGGRGGRASRLSRSGPVGAAVLVRDEHVPVREILEQGGRLAEVRGQHVDRVPGDPPRQVDCLVNA